MVFDANWWRSYQILVQAEHFISFRTSQKGNRALLSDAFFLFIGQMFDIDDTSYMVFLLFEMAPTSSILETWLLGCIFSFRSLQWKSQWIICLTRATNRKWTHLLSLFLLSGSISIVPASSLPFFTLFLSLFSSTRVLGFSSSLTLEG